MLERVEAGRHTIGQQRPDPVYIYFAILHQELITIQCTLWRIMNAQQEFLIFMAMPVSIYNSMFVKKSSNKVIIVKLILFHRRKKTF